MSEQRTPNDLQKFIDENAIDAKLHRDMGETPTVPAAALALGVEPEQIIKTLVFMVARIGEPGQPIVVISHGEKRVDRGKLAAHFAVAKGRINFAPTDIVLSVIGYPAGGVPPFGHRTALPLLLDASVIALEERFGGVIFGGGGDHHTMMELTIEELLRVTQPTILEVS